VEQLSCKFWVKGRGSEVKVGTMMRWVGGVNTGLHYYLQRKDWRQLINLYSLTYVHLNLLSSILSTALQWCLIRLFAVEPLITLLVRVTWLYLTITCRPCCYLRHSASAIQLVTISYSKHKCKTCFWFCNVFDSQSFNQSNSYWVIGFSV